MGGDYPQAGGPNGPGIYISTMPLNHYLTLGNSGLAVSPFCLGAMTFGEDWGWGSSVKESEAIMDTFLSRGGNFIDTANAYTRGHSEKIIGDHIGRHPARRHRAVIATKFSSNLFPGDPNAGGSSRKGILGQCEESLRRLQTDYIDLYWIHVWDSMTPIEETMRALDDLVRSGKVRYVGVSDTPAWKVSQAQTIARFRGFAPLIALQIEYSLLERTVEGELVPMAAEMGLGITPWSPLRFGILSGKYTRETAKDMKPDRGAWVQNSLTEKSFAALDVVRRVAKELGTTPARVALSWVQSRPGVTSTIIGARSAAQLEDNLGALDLKLPEDALAALNEVSMPQLNFPAAFVRGSGMFKRGGTTVNGETAPPWPMAPKSAAERY
jgi:aryl-alcohol dehydrogenase-like predicted oxidoreductase